MFHDRLDAASKLAEKLSEFRNQPDVILLGLVRGGFVVAAEIGRQLNLPAFPFVVRKIGHPENSEYAIGAISEFGEVLLHPEAAILEQKTLDHLIQVEKNELQRRVQVYRADRAGKNLPPLRDRTVLLVDDGIATGMTMKAAVMDIKKQQPKAVLIAVPVSSRDSSEELSGMVDRFIVLHLPFFFDAVGRFYEFFPQVTDAEILELF